MINHGPFYTTCSVDTGVPTGYGGSLTGGQTGVLGQTAARGGEKEKEMEAAERAMIDRDGSGRRKEVLRALYATTVGMTSQYMHRRGPGDVSVHPGRFDTTTRLMASEPSFFVEDTSGSGTVSVRVRE